MLARIACWLLLLCATPAIAGPRPPNFLVIVADDLGFSDLGAFGGEIRTPNLDRLARSGLRFSSFYAAPTCSPSRAMLLTGVDAHKAGLGNMAEDLAPNQRGHEEYLGHLGRNVATVAERLRSAGYATYMAGKWHLGGTEDQSPAARGFDRSFALLQGGASHYDMTGPVAESPRARYREDGRLVEQLPKDFYSTDYYASRIIENLRERRADQPFFAYLAFTAPHWPLQAPEATIRRNMPRYADGPAALRSRRLAGLRREGLLREDVVPHDFVPPAPTWATLPAETRAREVRQMATFAAMVERMDAAVGRVLRELRRSGALDDTWIIFLSDNGAEGHDLAALADFHDYVLSFDQRTERIGRPGSYTWYGPSWAQAATAPSRLHKGYPTEGGIHVPAFVWSAHLQTKGINSSLVSVMDVTPTVLDLAGVTFQGTRFDGREVRAIEGRSLSALLAGRVPAVRGDQDFLGWELFGRSAIRSGRWKALQLGQTTADRRWTLHDLERDPIEAVDATAQHPEEANRLRMMWEQYSTENGVILPDVVTGY